MALNLKGASSGSEFFSNSTRSLVATGLATVALASLLSACSSQSTTTVSPSSVSPSHVLNSASEGEGNARSGALPSDGAVPAEGQLVIAGPVPPIVPLSSILESAHALGFVPVETLHDGRWLSIERSLTSDDSKTGVVRLMEGSKEIAQGAVEGVSSLRPGTFSVRHKQRSALWHAPEEYFAARGLDVPAVGTKARFLRGALGEFALFIDKDTPIHSGPIATDEIGGIRAEEDLLSQLYYSLEVGSPIEVR